MGLKAEDSIGSLFQSVSALTGSATYQPVGTPPRGECTLNRSPRHTPPPSLRAKRGNPVRAMAGAPMDCRVAALLAMTRESRSATPCHSLPHTPPSSLRAKRGNPVRAMAGAPLDCRVAVLLAMTRESRSATPSRTRPHRHCERSAAIQCVRWLGRPWIAASLRSSQ